MTPAAMVKDGSVFERRMEAVETGVTTNHEKKRKNKQT